MWWREIVRRSLFMGLLLALLLPAWVGAEEPLGEQAVSSLDALKKANAYSFDKAGIGLLIRFGRGNGASVTPASIGEQFVAEINKRGIPARYFYYYADWPGMTVEYHIGYSALGPWDADTAASNLSEAVARARAMRRIHGQ